MKRYLVGGAVRDRLLGLALGDRDWVVVGVTPEQMLAAGYRPVGKDFPVFLDVKTGEEHALARTERKSGHGYRGFTFHTGPEVTLEDDLRRRDLTVNAIAQDDEGRLIDPYGGQADLRARLLRHVSPAFAEDPLRVLRVARFHARFATLGFRVADETLALMRQMVDDGEVDHLVPERVWKEMSRALMHARPSVFFQTLRDCGALARILPEVDALFGVPQRADYHPEIDTGIHTLMCVDAAARAGAALPVRFAALVHDLGKARTPPDEWPQHRQHEQRGVAPVRAVCERLRVPNDCRDLAIDVTREHLNVHRAFELRPTTLHDLIERLGGLRRPERFEQALQACEADARGRLGHESSAYPQTDHLRAAREIAIAIQAADVMHEGVQGAEIGRRLREARVAALKRGLSRCSTGDPEG
ncbi:multifunctional CCA addition/repair protein [Sinimarinibacterium sp. CAU 1509]|uniref:multifunctional CCA addition/repair protein n=1 Tax=Sinimarinibacterium sp. CAU 1509 TaxID=2562283 RepID=UPI0010AD6F33|nr:multifunctional CCA addition/repair protein [Sinimarinibacterium sp. CAU 1509]TJY59897.1 multifunctional CCA addition/repair protein [Sinimarinibacterium sp. CAU 1509]